MSRKSSDQGCNDIGRTERFRTMNVPEAIFRAYDIRGAVGRDFDSDLVRAIGQAFGAEARERGQQRVAIGRDGRLSSPALAQSLAEGLLAAGIDVVDVGLVPSPVLYFAALEHTNGNGVMVTGSHNPPSDNGLKLMLEGDPLAGDAVGALRARLLDGRLCQGAGSRSRLDVEDAYRERIGNDIRLVRPLKVVVDAGNGVAGAWAPPILRQIGCEVVELYCEVDGRFPHHHPDPSRAENLVDLTAAVVREGADLGLAFDGDGDRIGVVTERGKIIRADRLLALYARDVLARNPGAEIIFDVKCSRQLFRVIREAGGRPVMWRTGHSPIKAKMKASGAPLAGELSGHIFFKERWFGVDDAIYAAARLLEIVAREAGSADDLFATIPDAYNTPELHVAMGEGDPRTLMTELMAQRHSFGDAEQTTIDGLRLDFVDGWGLVRASNTTPDLVLRFEADTREALARIQTRFRILLGRLRPGLPLPF